jgi:dihydroneopterin aldolase
MSDRITLKGIDVFAHHGAHSAERELGQRFVIDLELTVDCSAAGQSDSLDQALDYSAVHRAIRQWAVQDTFHLIEAVAHHLCVRLFGEFRLDKVAVTVHKPHAPLPDFQGSVSVTLERDRLWWEQLGDSDA